MKCPICGKEKFIEEDPNQLIQCDNRLMFRSYMCTECGFVYFQNSERISKYHNAFSEVKRLKKEVEELDGKITEIEGKKLDTKKLKVRISYLRKKIITCETNREANHCHDEIHDIEKVLEMGRTYEDNRLLSEFKMLKRKTIDHIRALEYNVIKPIDQDYKITYE